MRLWVYAKLDEEMMEDRLKFNTVGDTLEHFSNCIEEAIDEAKVTYIIILDEDGNEVKDK